MQDFLDIVINKDKIIRRITGDLAFRVKGNKRIIVISNTNDWKIKIEESAPALLYGGADFILSEGMIYYLYEGKSDLYLLIESN